MTEASKGMRVAKDSAYEFSYAVWQLRPPQHTMTVVVKATYALVHGGVCVDAEKPVPCGGDAHWDDDPDASLRLDGDLALTKPRGECTLAGTCYAPNGVPAAAVQVRMRVGAIDRSITVVGDRHWSSNGVLEGPAPFEKMPLRWERAFGGPGFAENPVGVGITPVDTPRGRVVPLPNLEDPFALIHTQGARPPPAHLGPLHRLWSARIRHAGTYDDRWRDTRWPWFPDDFSPAYFNAAPIEQQIDGYWRGDERILLRGFHPKHTEIDTHLPGRRVRAFVDRRNADGQGVFTELAMRLDTIAIDADKGEVYCLWRGTVDVADEKLSDVDRLFYLDAPAAEPPRDLAACEALMWQKIRELDGDDEEQESDADDDENFVSPPEVPLEETPAVKRLTARFNEALIPAGVTLAGLSAGAKSEPLPKASAVVAELERQRRPVPAEVRAAAVAEAEIDGEVEGQAPAELTRDDVERMAAAGEDLTERDLTGLDLSELDLSGVDFSGCVLRGARLDRCRLEGTLFDEANLSEAILARSFARGASFLEADLSKARADAATFRGAVFDGADAEEASFEHCDFEEASFERAGFHKARCASARFVKAKLTTADFTEAVLTGADFTEASLVDTSLERSRAEGANFDRADMTGARPSEGARFERATLTEIKGAKSQWAGSVLDDADLTHAELERADFTGANLVRARLDGIKARRACFQEAVLVGASALGADVFQGSFEAADLSHADLRGANLFAAQLWRAKTEGTQLTLANLDRTHLEGEERPT